MNLVLGTAQFGLDYGVTNKEGQLSFDTVLQILNECSNSNVLELDTASSYGNAEQVLGRALKELGKEKDFKITSKVYLSEDQTVDDVRSIFETTLENLKGAHVSNFLVHQGSQLIELGDSFAREIESLKREFHIDKIGISVYSTDELKACLEMMVVDVFQAPFNIINQSFKNLVEREEGQYKGTDIYLRSLFLQGVLLSTIEKRPTYFDNFSDILNKYDSFLEKEGLSRLEAVLSAAKSFSHAKGIVFGCANLRELKEIIDLWNKVEALPSEKIIGLASSNEELLNPSLWRI